jgi:hypothetical protein
MQGSRRATVAQLRAWAKRLGIAPEEIAVLLAAEQVPAEETLRRQSMMRHWTAEAEAVIRDDVHLKILQLCCAPGFRADCRWIAHQAGVSVDAVNLALQRLLRLGLIEMRSGGAWEDRTGLTRLTPSEFRRVALARVRQKAAEDQVKFGKETTKRG